MSSRRYLLRAVASVVLAAFVLTSCGTTRTIDVGAPAGFADEVRPGDRVSVTTRDGRELVFYRRAHELTF